MPHLLIHDTECLIHSNHTLFCHNLDTLTSSISHRLATESANRGSGTMYAWFSAEACLLSLRIVRELVKSPATTPGVLSQIYFHDHSIQECRLGSDHEYSRGVT